MNYDFEGLSYEIRCKRNKEFSVKNETREKKITNFLYYSECFCILIIKAFFGTEFFSLLTRL